MINNSLGARHLPSTPINELMTLARNKRSVQDAIASMAGRREIMRAMAPSETAAVVTLELRLMCVSENPGRILTKDNDDTETNIALLLNDLTKYWSFYLRTKVPDSRHISFSPIIQQHIKSKGVAAFHPRRHGLFQGYQSSGGENISPNTASEGSDPPAFDAAEHKWLGDNILLATGINGRNCYRAGTKAFTLPNTVKLTYGEICLLADDFFGTSSPISDGKDDADRTKRFEDAWETLAEYKRSDAKDILKILQPELDAVNRAFKEHRDPSDEYSKLKNVDWDLERATARMWKFGFPTYFQLASYNWDHFGDDAYTCYKVGHAAAIKYARTHHGDVNGLNQAYAMNAFADHFLQDIFSAGHVRTPRRQLHRPLFPYYPDMCAKMMHDEDCAIGLSVKDSSGKAWTMYGDKRLLDDANSDNFGRCQEAVQTSADEIYDAWIGTKKTSDFKALDLAPTLESALGTDQKLAPLFKVQGNEVLRRENIKDRRNHTSTTPSWSYRGTYDECGKSGWWKHPITLDGPSA